MNDILDLVFLFFGLMLLDLICLITFIKPVKKSVDLKKRIDYFKSVLFKKYSLISLFIELIGIILLIYSFSIPWYYHLYRGWINETRYFYIKEAVDLDKLLIFLLYYAYFMGLFLLFVKISTKRKIRTFTLLEIIELIYFIPGIIFIFNVEFLPCSNFIIIPEMYCAKSDYSSGFILYTIGITILIINGLQISIYSRLKRRKNQIKRVQI